MIRTTSVTPFLLMGMLSFGCNKDHEVKTLPPEYRVLATVLAQETKNSTEGFRDNLGLPEIIAGLHSGVLDLRGIKSTNTDITYIADLGDKALTEAVRRLEKLKNLPKPPGEGELFFSSFIDGFFGNFQGGYARGKDAENKQEALLVEGQGLIAALEKLDSASLLLLRVAKEYSNPTVANAGRLRVYFHEKWGGRLSHDWMFLRNDGLEMEDCTILVEIMGQDGKVRKNVHFVPEWSSNTLVCCRYDSYFTVNNVDTVDITIFSPKFSTKFNYKYSGEEANKNIQEYCDKVTFAMIYRPFKAGVFWDDQRAVNFYYLGGGGFLPMCKVEVTFKNGNQSEGWIWNRDNWIEKEWKLFETPKGGLTFDPKTIDILITFPNSTAQIKRTYKVE